MNLKLFKLYVKCNVGLLALLVSQFAFSNVTPNSCNDDAMATIIRGPYLQNLTTSSVVIRWKTSSNTQSIIRYGTSINNINTLVSDATPKIHHDVSLTGTVGTKYYYQIEDNIGILAGPSSDMYFQLAPPIGSQVSVNAWILGDSGTGNGSARAVRDAYYSYRNNNHTDLILFLGDNAYNNGTEAEYQSAMFTNMYEGLMQKSASFSCLGNHDDRSVGIPNEYSYYDIFNFPTLGEGGGLASGTEAYYSFDYANIHFIILDSHATNRNQGAPMYDWAEMDIQNTTQDWIVAMWHHPPYTKGSHDSDNVNDSDGRMQDMRANFLPMLEDNGVDLVLSGHSHSYERSYFVNGHYGNSTSFNHNIHTIPISGNGDGQVNGTGQYEKSQCTPGSVYITTGSAGKTSFGSLDHPVMYFSKQALGSTIMEVQGHTMNIKFLRENGAVDDFFTIEKEVVGLICDDGDPNTHFDAYDNSCNCVGIVNGQCNDGDDFNISEFTVVNNVTNFSQGEISGLTKTSAGDVLYLVTDSGRKIIKSNENGTEEYTLGSQYCPDYESISYISDVSSTVKRFAIAEERSRQIYVVDINDLNNSATVVFTISISGVSQACNSNNRGMEALAYDAQTNTMYFGEEQNRIIKKFAFPTGSIDQTVTAVQVVNLSTIPGLISCTLSGMDILPSGNVILLMTHGTGINQTTPCSGDSGDYSRKLVEIDPCGNFVEEFDLETVQGLGFDTHELEGVSATDGHIYLIGEDRELYDLVRNLPSSITVNSPGTGDVFNPGDQFTIQWTSQNISGNVKIELYKGNSIVRTLSPSTNDDGSFISNILSTTNAYGSDYRIKITSINATSINDFGNSFTVQAGPSITVTNPGNGDVFSPGDGISASWISNGISGNVKIELFESNTSIATLITSTSNDNIQQLLLPSNVQPGNNYKLKISSINDDTIFDFGDVFTIQTAPSITVVSPGTTDVFSPGDLFTVNWNSVNISGNVKIELYQGNNIIRLLAGNTSNDGNATFSFTTSSAAGTNYKIKITSLTNTNIFDFGHNFTIQTVPTIIVTNPTGGSFVIGQMVNITWTTTNVSGNIKLVLLSGNNVVSNISGNTPNDGSYTFTILANVSPDNNYTVKASSVNDNSIFDASSTFIISAAPSITVLNPGTGDVFNPGQSLSVQWSSTGITGNVSIKLIKGSTTLVSTLSTSTIDDGQQSFTLPSPLSDGANYRILIQSVSGGNVLDYGEYFTISNACPEDLQISNTTNANSNQEAGSTITTNQAVQLSNTAVYHAGDEVLLTDGFLAPTGSIFRAYIEGCTGTFQSLRNDAKIGSQE